VLTLKAHKIKHPFEYCRTNKKRSSFVYLEKIKNRNDYEGLSFVFFTNVTPAKKKMAPNMLKIIISFIFWPDPLPFMKLMPAIINPAIPSSERIKPNTRFSILSVLGKVPYNKIRSKEKGNNPITGNDIPVYDKSGRISLNR
jgi:hypothetical protein